MPAWKTVYALKKESADMQMLLIKSIIHFTMDFSKAKSRLPFKALI